MRLEFLREDLLIQIDEAAVALTSGKVVDRFDVKNPEELAKVQKSAAVQRWVKRIPRAHYPSIFRICLDVRARTQQTQNWESSVLRFVNNVRLRSQTLSPLVIVRVSPVWARSANFPFTLPLRLIELNAAPREHVRPAVSKVFNNKPLEKYEAALRTVHLNWERWDLFDLPANWPTAEVLHFNKMPPFPEGQMLSGDASIQGTLGWFVEKLVTWQVRLVVVRCNPGRELEQMRLFASSLLARGGPAVLVEALKGRAAQHEFYNMFYEQLIHDFPLDAAWQTAFFSHPSSNFDASLFVGGGREEQLRSSNIALRLAEFGSKQNRARRRVTLDQMYAHPDPVRWRREIRENLEKGLDEIHSGWSTYRFEYREREGLLPLSEVVASWRSLAGPVPATDLYSHTTASLARYVNCSFWKADATHELRQIDQRAGSFKQGLLYQFGIQIGPKNRRIFTVNETALLEEVFKWTPEMKGVWIEIGVTGIDFDVVGDPVQRVWLPAPGDGPTDTVYFSVVPRKSGVNRLRFAIYYEQNVIQSFRVGLVTDRRIKDKRIALAKALEIRPKLSANVAYLPVLEFSLAPSIDDFAGNPSHAKRTVAIIANELGGDPVVTVKNASAFGVNVPNFLPGEVAKLHNDLLAVSNLHQPHLPYPFTARNEGTQTELENTLRILAEHGAGLFQYLIHSDLWDDIRQALEQPDQTIQVAQILRDKVIPWSFVYSRKLDPRASDYDQKGKLTNIPVCLASLPDATGGLPSTTCGSAPTCMLQLNPGLQPANVVCPLQFWGFKHVVEIPPKQIDTKAKSKTAGAVNPSSVQTAIKVNGSARIVAGVNGSLGSESLHFTNLAKLKTKFPLSNLKQQYTFANLGSELAKSPLHIAYFFCHAEGGTKVANRIVLQEPAQNAPEYVPFIKFGNLFNGNKWDPPALVFLNACKSANYSPEALSPFLSTFVDTLGASGVIGTEVDVWDVFAAEIGNIFLEKFLNGEAAGISLLKARRVLLSKNNPLGLVYTLFAAADLHLE